ncbi:MAG TPA: ABC transporter ATP-binding protein [Sulfolobales archaeon]|nr:ABC transporter ATP-binding protein [Sulfolobales archaeon]
MVVEPVVILRDVWKIYRDPKVGETMALKGVNLVVNRGEIMAIHGPSGSGKSTLLKLIAGLLRPDRGDVIVDGYNLSMLDEEGLAMIRNTVVGYIPQDYGLVEDLNVYENVELPLLIAGVPKKIREEKVSEILEYMGLRSMASKPARFLSGGEKQRVAIARAMVNTPSVILADEPTANLDWDSSMRALDMLKSLNRDFKTTVIIVSHDPRVIDYADRAVIMVSGVLKSYKESRV